MLLYMCGMGAWLLWTRLYTVREKKESSLWWHPPEILKLMDYQGSIVSSQARHLSPKTTTPVVNKNDVASQLLLPPLWSTGILEIKSL